MNIFDFDGTLYDGDSTIDFWKYALRSHPKSIRWIPLQGLAFIRHACKAISLENMKSDFYTFLQDIPDMHQCIKNFWTKNRNKIKPEVLKFAQKGDLVISASPQFLLQPICDELHLGLIASEVDVATGHLLGLNCKGEEKVRRLERSEYPLEYEKAFSDSRSDIPIFRLAKEAFIVKGKNITPFDSEN